MYNNRAVNISQAKFRLFGKKFSERFVGIAKAKNREAVSGLSAILYNLLDSLPLSASAADVSDGDISFDYKLHKGISKTTNAIRLLELIGFPEEIIKNASAQ